MKKLKLLFAAAAAVTMTFAAQAEKTAKAVVSDGGTTLRFVYDETIYGAKNTDWFSVAEAESQPEYNFYKPWYLPMHESLQKVVFDVSFRNYRPTNCSNWFYLCENLESVEGLQNLDTSNVTSLHRMFFSCKKIKMLDFSCFDTANVTNMYWMLRDCEALETVYVSDKFVTSQVTDSVGMFFNCIKLVGGNGTTYSGDHTDATYARADKSGQPGYFTERLPEPVAVGTPDGKLFFYYDLFDHTQEGKVYSVPPRADEFETATKAWYDDRANFTTVVFDASFAQFKPTSLFAWFKDFTRVTSFVGLENLNTSDVELMNYLFQNCSSLTALDLTGFNTSKATDMSGMFQDCANLSTIVSSSFATGQKTSSAHMFENCTSLRGANGTVYDATKTDATCARIDGPGSPGYFSRRMKAVVVYNATNARITFYYPEIRRACNYGWRRVSDLRLTAAES